MKLNDDRPHLERNTDYFSRSQIWMALLVIFAAYVAFGMWAAKNYEPEKSETVDISNFDKAMIEDGRR